MLLAGCGIRPVCRDRLDLRKEPHAVFSKHVQIPEEGVLVPAERENADRNRNPDIDADHAAIRAAGALLAELGCVDADYAIKSGRARDSAALDYLIFTLASAKPVAR